MVLLALGILVADILETNNASQFYSLLERSYYYL